MMVTHQNGSNQIRLTVTITNAAEDVEKLEPLYTAGGNGLATLLFF